MASADTNILLRWLLHDVPEQADLVERLTAKDRLEVADAAILEAVFVMEKFYQMPRRMVCDNLQAVLASRQFDCNRLLFAKVLPAYHSKAKLSFTDCYLAVYAELAGDASHYTFTSSWQRKCLRQVC